MVVDTCAIWGGAGYVDGWLSINILIILVSLLAIAVAHSISSFLPANTRGRVRSFVRFEMIQLIVSIIILGALLAFSAAACSISATLSQSLAQTRMSPFQYADYYVGQVSLGTGLTLLSNIYSTAVSYAIFASVANFLPNAALRFGLRSSPLFNNPLTNYLTQKTNGVPWPISWVPGLGGLCTGKNGCDYERIPTLDISKMYTLVADLYIAVYSPIILIAVGLLFIQFLALPIMQYTAFTIILPVALGMRSIAFFGAHIGDASNALIAIAVAFYIIYPMTVAFDSYAIHYVFSADNPAAQYADSAFTACPAIAGSVASTCAVKPNAFFQTNPSQTSSPSCTVFGVSLPNSGFCLVINQLGDLYGGALGSQSLSAYVPIFGVIKGIQTTTDNMAQFVFQAVLLFALNVSITMGLAVSLYKALRSGLGEAGRFW